MIPKDTETVVYSGMLQYNREKETARKMREKKEREWQEELDRSMNLSDPTGQGKSFFSKKNFSLKGLSR